MNKMVSKSIIITLFGLLLQWHVAVAISSGQQLLNAVDSLIEENYSIPSWTSLLRAKQSYSTYNDSLSEIKFSEAIQRLLPQNRPYNIALTINGDPTSQIGITWFTNKISSVGRVQLLEGNVVDTTMFINSIIISDIDTVNLKEINYCNPSNNLLQLAAIPNNAKRNYTSHKITLHGLKPNTAYSFRVGEQNSWSSVGHFKTSAVSNKGFKFLYVTDTQAANDAAFKVASSTIKQAYKTVSDARFCVVAGDLVQSMGSLNSEWEWEQWFELLQPIWMQLPIVPLCGNHDNSINRNFTHHFNTQTIGFDQKLSTTPGSVYSFVYDDALFIALNTEDYALSGYLDSIQQYVVNEVNKYPNIRWKIVLSHKSVYAGSTVHQNDLDGRKVREELVPVFDALGIDLVLHGHDHVYEVIGPTRNFKLVDNSVSNVVNESVGGLDSNMNGKSGGVFDVSNGTLYFLNGNAGSKKYHPKTQGAMDASFNFHGVDNYFNLFTGKLGQSFLATFTEVEVTYDQIFLNTYTVNGVGDATTLYDSFVIVKSQENLSTGDEIKRINCGLVVEIFNGKVIVSTNELITEMRLYSMSGELKTTVFNTNFIDILGLPAGIYILQTVQNGTMQSTKINIAN